MKSLFLMKNPLFLMKNPYFGEKPSILMKNPRYSIYMFTITYIHMYICIYTYVYMDIGISIEGSYLDVRRYFWYRDISIWRSYLDVRRDIYGIEGYLRYGGLFMIFMIWRYMGYENMEDMEVKCDPRIGSLLTLFLVKYR
jgi:hypothetical protein